VGSWYLKFWQLVSISLHCRSFIEDSGANIKISPHDNTYIVLTDRLVTIIGTLPQLGQAINMILSKLSEDVYYVQSIGPTFPYAGMIFFLPKLIFILIHSWKLIVSCCYMFVSTIYIVPMLTITCIRVQLFFVFTNIRWKSWEMLHTYTCDKYDYIRNLITNIIYLLLIGWFRGL